MNDFTYMKDRDFSQGRKYIGASDISTLAGINEYKTPFDLWSEWTARKEIFKGNARTRAGNRQEPIILSEYIFDKMARDYFNDDSEGAKEKIKIAHKTKNEFIISRLFEDTQYGQYHSWTESHAADNLQFVAHADLVDMDKKVLVQAKNTGQYAADVRRRNPYKGYARDDLSQNGIPLNVYLQEQWELYCYGIEYAFVAVQIDGWDIKIYGPVQYRKEDVEKLVILADRFLWHIGHDVAPTPQNWPDVVSLFPRIEKETKTVLSELDEQDARLMLKQMATINEKIRVLEKRKLDINMAFALLAGEPQNKFMHQYLTTSTGEKIASFTDKQGQRRISVSRLEKEAPEIFRQLDELGFVTCDESSRMIYLSGSPSGSVNLFTAITFDENGKEKRSRKKYTKEEKDDIENFCKSVDLKINFERYIK